MHATVLHNPLVQYSRGLNWYGNIDKLAVLARGGAILKRCLSCSPKRIGTANQSQHMSFFGGGSSSKLELIEPFVQGWGERYCNPNQQVAVMHLEVVFQPPLKSTRRRYCNKVNYVKNNAIFEPPSMRACSSTPPKQNQDFVKEHNRTPFRHTQLLVFGYFWMPDKTCC